MKCNGIHRIYLRVLFLLFPLSSVSQHYVGVGDSIRLEEVQVTAARYPQSLRSVAAPVQVIGASHINTAISGDLSTVLAAVPGVQLQMATAQTLKLTLRGIGSRSQYGTNRTQVYLNDISLTGGDGTAIFDDLELSFVERAELVKGSYSAWYGSGMGGAVRFVTRSPGVSYDRGGKVLLAEAGITAASFGMFKLTGLVSVGTPTTQLTAGIARLSGEGYRDNSAFSRTSGMFTGMHQFPVLGKLNYVLLLSDVKAFTPSSVDESTFRNNPSAAAANWLSVKGFKEYQRLMSGVKLETPLSSDWSNTLLVTSNYYNQFELRPFNILDDQSNSWSIQESIRFTRPGFTIVSGIEGFVERYSWQTQVNETRAVINDARELRSYFNAFANLGIKPVEQLQITVGINVNRTGYKLQQSTQMHDKADFLPPVILSPMSGIVYRINERISLYGSAGHGFSNPTVEESLRSDGSINTSLRPEQGWTFDLGFKSWHLNSRLALQGSVYTILLNDLLVIKRPVEDVFYGDNAGSSELRGIEGLIRYRPVNWLNYSLSLTASDNKFRVFEEAGVNYAGKQLPGVPIFQLFSQLEAELPYDFQFHLTYRKSGSQYADDANLVQVDGWQTLDAGLTYQSKPGGILRIKSTLSVFNVFDEHYAGMVLINAPSFAGRAPRYYYPALPRNWAAKLQLQW
jgi:iron complex outermembrane receptor protein